MATCDIVKTEILADGFCFLEGPRWHGNRLWMSDFFHETVYTVDLDGNTNKVVEVPGRPSGLGFLPDGVPLIVSMQDRKLYRLDNNKLIAHADLSHVCGGDANDMVVDHQGRAYVGNFGFDLWGDGEYESANLIMVSSDGGVRVVAKEMAFPNGTVLIAGGTVLVVAETFSHCLTAFDVAGDGTLSNRRLFADLGRYDPDGICLDQQGAIWVSAYNSGEFLRVLEGGLITNRIRVEGRQAVACQLGGEDMRTLFCLTCEGSWEDVGKGQGRARVEIVEVDVPGAGSP